MRIAVNFNKLENHVRLIDEERKELWRMKESLEQYLMLNIDNPMLDVCCIQKDIELIGLLERSIKMRTDFLEGVSENFMFAKTEIEEFLYDSSKVLQRL